MGTNDESILDTTKEALGLAADYSPFDGEIKMHINSVLGTLNQLGIGPNLGFEVTGSDEQWSDILGQELRFAAVKSYVFLRVRVLYDPPDNPAVMNAFKEQIAQAEWRINVAREDRDYPAAEVSDLNPNESYVLEGGTP